MLEQVLEWQKVFTKNSTGYMREFVVALVSGRTEGRKVFLVCDIQDDSLSIARLFQGTTDGEVVKTRFVWTDPPQKVYKHHVEDEILRIWSVVKEIEKVEYEGESEKI